MFSVITSAIFALGPDPQKMVQSIGLIGLLIVIFAESGLLIGFFLPGDSLLFAAGLVTAGITLDNGTEWTLANGNVAVVAILCALAAIAGDQVGYAFGKRVGPSLFKKSESKLFKPAYVEKTEEFFAKHGSKSIVLARFVPIVRTFTPVVAGVSKMHYRTFVKFNVIGGAIWGAGFILLGYWLGSAFPAIGKNIEYAIVAIVVISLIPIAIEFLRHRRNKPKGKHFAE